MQNIERLRSIYKHTAKIDLIVGGVAERALPGATVGATFACLFGEQFARRSGSNSVDERYERLLRIAGYTAAHFVCEHTELEAVPRNAFHVASEE